MISLLGFEQATGHAGLGAVSTESLPHEPESFAAVLARGYSDSGRPSEAATGSGQDSQDTAVEPQPMMREASRESAALAFGAGQSTAVLGPVHDNAHLFGLVDLGDAGLDSLASLPMDTPAPDPVLRLAMLQREAGLPQFESPRPAARDAIMRTAVPGSDTVPGPLSTTSAELRIGPVQFDGALQSPVVVSVPTQPAAADAEKYRVLGAERPVGTQGTAALRELDDFALRSRTVPAVHVSERQGVVAATPSQPAPHVHALDRGNVAVTGATTSQPATGMEALQLPVDAAASSLPQAAMTPPGAGNPSSGTGSVGAVDPLASSMRSRRPVERLVSSSTPTHENATAAGTMEMAPERRPENAMGAQPTVTPIAMPRGAPVGLARPRGGDVGAVTGSEAASVRGPINLAPGASIDALERPATSRLEPLAPTIEARPGLQMAATHADLPERMVNPLPGAPQAMTDTTTALSPAAMETSQAALKVDEAALQRAAARLPEGSAERTLTTLEQQVRVSLARGMNHASVELEPRELGRVEVAIARQGDELQVSFKVQNPQVKDLIEASTGRLRDALAEAGLQLTDADVRSGAEQRQSSAEREQHAAERAAASADDLPQAPTQLDLRTSSGLVDLRV